MPVNGGKKGTMSKMLDGDQQKAPMKVLATLRSCKRCLLVETHDTVVFDEEGICNVCRNIEHKQEKVDWRAKERELEQVLDEYRSKHAYDCIIPLTGGKGSALTGYILVTQNKIKTLVGSF